MRMKGRATAHSSVAYCTQRVLKIVAMLSIAEGIVRAFLTFAKRKDFLQSGLSLQGAILLNDHKTPTIGYEIFASCKYRQSDELSSGESMRGEFTFAQESKSLQQLLFGGVSSCENKA
mmetsp:Transcript_49394/g.130165  ORF Transcript_49394/g.130165 Transcript_49394/m.130165 type:complete len:118 (+) Transcript_49394:153-506(+)